MSRTHFVVTPRRKEIFLAELEATGSMVAAARAATPGSAGRKGGLQAFRDETRYPVRDKCRAISGDPLRAISPYSDSGGGGSSGFGFIVF
jgi:hypothetical protein